MLSFEAVGNILDDIAEQLPSDFYKELNGGINLLPDEKLHRKSVDTCKLYILGDYHNERLLGRYINIYYGSFMKVCAHLDYIQQKVELRKILLHEFTHHMESLAGERDLEIKDFYDLEKYLQQFNKENADNRS